MGKGSSQTKKKSKTLAASQKQLQFPTSLLSSSEVSKQHEKPRKNFTTLLDDRIWIVRGFFTDQECQSWIEYMEANNQMEYVQHRATRMIAQRECYRFQRNDPDMANRIFDRLVEYYPTLAPAISRMDSPITCNPNLRVYKYTKGMSFGKHIDGSDTVINVGKTRLTILIYLSSCQGGATWFEGNVSFKPEVGAMLLHIHGDDCLLHEGKPVKSGVKYVLRTDLVYPFTT